MSEVLDLDALSPKPVLFRLNGHEIDVSFIPVGITFELDEIVQELAQYSVADLQGGGEITKRALILSVKMCALFCSLEHPEMTEDWFSRRTTPDQIQPLAKAIGDTLVASLEAMERYQKNLITAQVTEPST